MFLLSFDFSLISFHIPCESLIEQFYSFFLFVALTKRTTQIWFQNARARIKKKPCATTSSPPSYAKLMNNNNHNNLNLVDNLHLSTGKHLFFSNEKIT